MPLSHMQIWNAIDAVARERDLSPSALARKAGLDATSFNPSKRFVGAGDHPRPRWPSTESLSRVLQVAGMTLAEFADLARDGKPTAGIPLLGLAQAGRNGFFDDAGLPAGEGWDETELPQAGPTVFSLKITGDSMTPLYRAGDRVIVDQSATRVRKGDRVVARTREGETLAKEVAAIDAKSVTLASINPTYPPRTLKRRDIVWMSRILWASQ